MSFSCDLNTLIRQSACFADKCCSQADRDTISIYLRMVNLAAIGGTNYVGNILKLMKDTSLWVRQSADTIDTVGLAIRTNNAVANGGSGVDPLISQGPSAIMKQAKCLRIPCLGPQQTNGINAFLTCQINSLGKPD